MKRILISLLATVGGLIALLDFKSQGHPLATSGPLPSAGVGSTSSAPAGQPSSTAGSTPASTGSTGSSAGSTAASAAATAAAKTYQGSAVTTRYGIVQVKITVQGSKITNVGFVQLTAFDGRSQFINSQAAPILLNETIQAQGAQIDTVSGATFTSDGFIQSLQSALTSAGLK